MKVHLIDGTYELFRAFYGAPSATTEDGREVAATRALGRSLLGLLSRADVTHVAVAFDHVIESFRNELFEGYKTGLGIDPKLWAQFPLAEQMTDALGIVTWPMVEFEADDAIATAAARFVDDARVEQIVLASPDKDFAQCVRGHRVVLWDRRRDLVYDEEGVVQKWGVGPSSIPDWLALVGDSADGFPGVPRWGTKSASMLLSHYGTLEAIPAQSEDWEVRVRGARGLAENLHEHRSNALLFKTLATLRVDVPLEESLDDLEWRGADRVRLDQLSQVIEDEGLLDRVDAFRDE